MAKTKELTKEDWDLIVNIIAIPLGLLILMLKPRNFVKILLWVWIPIFMPAFLLLNLIFSSWLTNRKLRNITNTNHDFWLDEEEQQEFIKKYKYLCNIRAKLHEAWELSIGHRTRNDGRVDERSYAGKRANALNDQYGPLEEEAEEDYEEITHRPLERWKNFNALMRQRIACLATMALGGISLGVLSILYRFDQTVIPVDIIRNFATAITDQNESFIGAIIYFAVVMFYPNAILFGIYCLFLFIFWKAGKKYSPEPPIVDDDNFCALWKMAGEIDRSSIQKKVANVIIEEENECNVDGAIDKLQAQAIKNLKHGSLKQTNIACGRALVLACEMPCLEKLHKKNLILVMLAVYIPALFTFIPVTLMRFQRGTMFFDPVHGLTLLGSIGLLWALCRSFARPAPIAFLIPAGLAIGYVSAPRIMSEPSIGSGLYFLIFGVVMTLQTLEFWKRLSLIFWGRMVYSAEKTEQITKGLKANFKPSKFSWTIALFSIIILMYGVYFPTFFFSQDKVSAEEFYKIGIQYIEGKGRSQNIEKGIQFITLAAKKDFFQAYYTLGNYQLTGNKGVPKDISQGIKNIQIAANKGLTDAQTRLAICLEKGIGINQNLTGAYFWYEKAATKDEKAQNALKRIGHIAKYWQDAHNGKSEAQYMLAICYASGNGIEKNETIARKWLKSAADKGYAKSQLALGVWLLNGRGGEKQIPLGIEYCEKSAKQNYSEAFNYLGKLFFDGKVTAQDYNKAVLYYNQAVKTGSLDAVFNLAYCYQKGLGTERNPVKAFELFKTAADKNFMPAAFCLAECYENGIGIDIDYTLALKYYSSSAAKKWKNSIIKKSNIDAAKSKKRLSVIGKYWAAANKKDVNAQYKVAVCYLQANGVKKDIKKAFDWFSAAAKQNNVDAIVMLAEYQLKGILVEKNEKAAFETFVQAVDKGSVAAMLRLGRCYEGGLGVEQNLTTAYMWYMKFAQKHPVTGKKEAQRIEKVANVWDKALKENNPEAQFLLAEYYSEDTPGLKKDLKKSFALYKKAAEQGHVEAMFKLTGCYAKGKGVDQDIPSAIDWCKKAADKNHGNALFEMGRLYQQGIAVTQNLTTAYDYFDKAEIAKFNRATQAKAEIATIAQCWQNAYDGDAANQYKLAVCYFKGIGIEKNNTVAQQWLEKSAAQKYSEAQYDLAVIYMLDKSPEKIKQAFELLTQAAAKNHIKAMVKLGECYYNGLGVEDDYEKAIELWEKAIKENNSDAMYLLGVYRSTGRGFFNSGKDWDKALDLWEKASALGHKDASYKLANYYKEEKEDFNKSLKYFAKAAKQGHLQAMYIYGEYAYKQGLQDEGLALIKYAAEKGNADAVKFVNEVNKSQKQSKPNPVRQSSSTQENVSVRNNRVNINGANIAVKQNAKVLAEKDAIIAIKNIFAEWTPEKFISADFIPIEGQADKFIASERISENRIKMTTYVLMEFDKNKFYQKFVPEISNVLNNIAIKKQRFNRRSSTTPIGGFWWGDYASRNQSSFKLDAKYFIPEKVLKYREFDRSLCLNTNYDNFTIYELPENVSISSIVRKYRNSKFVLSVELLDKDKNTVKTLERIVTAKSDYGQSYFPVFGTTYPYVDMLIAPEFNGINEVRIDRDAYQFFPQLVRKVEGYVTEDELKNIVSMKISFEIK